MRSFALGFGLVTALAVAGSMTSAGQSVLGQRHPTEDAVQVSSIQDKAAAVPGPAQPLLAVPAASAAVPAPAPAASTSTVPPAPRRSQTAPVAARPPVTGAPHASQPPQAAPAQGGLGGIAGIANILLNLPQVLDQTHVGPSRGSDSWSESGSTHDHGKAKAHKWRPGQGDDDKEPNANH